MYLYSFIIHKYNYISKFSLLIYNNIFFDNLTFTQKPYIIAFHAVFQYFFFYVLLLHKLHGHYKLLRLHIKMSS